MTLMALTVLELEGGAVSAFAFVHGGIAALRSRALRPHRDARQLIALVTSPRRRITMRSPSRAMFLPRSL
jgi:hypothetical protein